MIQPLESFRQHFQTARSDALNSNTIRTQQEADELRLLVVAFTSGELSISEFRKQKREILEKYAHIILIGDINEWFRTCLFPGCIAVIRTLGNRTDH